MFNILLIALAIIAVISIFFYFFQERFIFHPEKLIDDKRSTNVLSELYDDNSIIIASPNRTHFEYIKKLISGFEGYIFCEKPPITSLVELKELKNLSEKEKSRIFFNFNFRF